MDDSRKQRLSQFLAWCAEHIKGDEKGEAQVYLDRLFQAFGQKGIKEAGAVLEMRIRREDNRGTAFADLVWKPKVLIEMKKRGEDLSRHYRQAFDYWVRLVPNRPRWVVLCNFDEFWVYDFETQMDTPVDQLPIAELPNRYDPLAFLFPTNETPRFGNNQEEVTRKAADRLALCFNKLVQRKVDRGMAQRFILQMLVALFAEDIGLLDHNFVTDLLDECDDPKDSYDLIGGLFVAMNTPEITGGRFKRVQYFNGGLFSEPARVELYPDELNQLRAAATFKWSKVRPEIFGTLFEHSLDQEERHAFGAHFTYPTDIMKIVGPTIVEPWREQIECAKTVKRLAELRQRMQTYTVLDPACGSGNFLYIAYRELKRLEARIFERMAELSSAKDKSQREFGFVTARQFFGLDINPFAIELAKVTMMIARKFAIDELHVNEQALPLDNLDQNFMACDALITADGSPTPWPRADVIIGNPPFLGAKRLKPERGPDYVNAVRRAYPEVPGMADYCVHWLRRAHDLLPDCKPSDPFAGRAGLVGTQNIRNNQSRVGGLGHVVKNGTIVEAVDNQPWSGEANVHVSIVNWIKSQNKRVLPASRRLWFKLQDGRKLAKTPRNSRNNNGPAHKQYQLAFRKCDHINSALSDQTDVAGARILRCNTDPQRVFQGQVPGHDAFVLSPSEADKLLKAERRNREVIHPFLVGRDVVTGAGKPTRWVIDFQDMDINKASAYSAPFQQIKTRVLPDRKRKSQEGKTQAGELRPHHQLFLRYWWRHSYDRPEMIKTLRRLARYIACSGVTKRPIFSFIRSDIRPDHACFVFAFQDDYSFGILQSSLHWLWFTTKCSKLTERFRYTPPSVYDTFPWPQSPKRGHVDAIAGAAREVRRVRSQALQNIKGGLRAVYRILELPGKNPLKDAHAALDQAVITAYGFSSRRDVLAQLLELNFEVADRIDKGKPVTAPGVPLGYPDPARLVTEDCIQP